MFRASEADSLPVARPEPKSVQPPERVMIVYKLDKMIGSPKPPLGPKADMKRAKRERQRSEKTEEEIEQERVIFGEEATQTPFHRSISHQEEVDDLSPLQRSSFKIWSEVSYFQRKQCTVNSLINLQS